jgi:hypothetical protein
VVELRVEAWRVHDTGLVAVPSRFRRLGGLVRHRQGHGPAWPDAVAVTVADGEVRVTDRTGQVVGSWPAGEVSASPVAAGPPVSFVLEVPGATHLLAAAAGEPTRALLAALRPPARP